MQNLLKNGNFEADWGDEKSHRCLVFPADGTPYEREVGNIFVPPGWVFWFRHEPGKWDQPEGRDAWKLNDPRRVHSGEKAYMYFTFFRKHDAGLFQQVQVTPGTRLRLTAWAHAWSNHKDGPHPDDGRWSEGPGYEAGFLLEGEAPNSEWENFTFYVGIDPTGGTDPFADTVVWSQGWHIYNGYCQQLTVEATSAAETVTVFLRSKTLWPFKHNDAYWDDAVLEVVEEPPSGRGQPRVQYERTYVLVPGNAGRDVMAAVASAAWPRRWTIGCSADDAGIGDLDVRRVILLDPQAWGGIEALQAFFEEYYPGVKVVYLNTSCSEAEYQPTSPMNWYQAVGRVLAARLLAEGFRLRYPTTHFERPAVTSEFGEDRDTYFHNGLDLRSSWSAYGDQVLSATSGEVVVAGWVDDEPWFGYQVRVRTTTPAGTELLVRYAHLVKGSIAVSVGDQVNVSDVLGKPDNTGSSYGDHLHIDVKVVGEPYNLDCHQHPYADPWPLLVGLPSHVVLPEPPPPEPPEPPEPPTGGLVSLHIQGGAHGDLEFVRRAKPAALKYVFGIERARGAKATLPSTLVVYRHWVPNQDQYLNHPGGVRRGARAYLETFLDALKANADWVDFAESLNEMVATGDVAGTQRLAEFDAAFAEVLAEEVGDAVRPALLTVAVGNPGENEVELLLPAVEAAVKYQGVLCYHAYWGVGPDGYCTMDTDWKWYAGRALEVWDPVFRAHGLYPRYLFTEGGAVAITGPGGAMNPGAGWRHETCLRGSWDKYLAQILEFRRRVQEWNRQHNNRCLGMTLFTVGGGAEWKWFELGDKLGALADALAS